MKGELEVKRFLPCPSHACCRPGTGPFELVSHLGAPPCAREFASISHPAEVLSASQIVRPIVVTLAHASLGVSSRRASASRPFASKYAAISRRFFIARAGFAGVSLVCCTPTWSADPQFGLLSRRPAATFPKGASSTSPSAARSSHGRAPLEHTRSA